MKNRVHTYITRRNFVDQSESKKFLWLVRSEVAGDAQKQMQKNICSSLSRKEITDGKRSKCVTASMGRVAMLDW